MPGWSKSSRFCDARIRADSFLRTRFRLLRIYSTAVRLLSQMYSSSSVATVFPSVSSLSLKKESTLNSMAFFTLLLAWSSPFTPKTRKRKLVIFVGPLKNLLSAPRHMEWRPSRISRSSSLGYSGFSSRS